MSKTRGLGLIFYGAPGVGKTSLALQFSVLGSVLCHSIKDSGYKDLEITGDVPPGCENLDIENWEDLVQSTKNSTTDVLVNDTLSGMQNYLFDYVCRTQYNGIWSGKDGFSSYYKGQRVDSPPVLQDYLDLLDKQRNQGRHIIITGHMVTTSEPNAHGADYLSHVLDMDQGDKGGCRSLLVKWAQAVVFMHISVDITLATERDKQQRVTEGKAKDDDNRLMYTTMSPGHSAKNRLKLPHLISMGTSPQEAFKNLWQHMPQAYKELTE